MYCSVRYVFSFLLSPTHLTLTILTIHLPLTSKLIYWNHNHIGVWIGAVFTHTHTQCNATTCQSFRSESLSVAAGPPSQTTPSRPRSVSTRGRGRGHQPSPSQSGLTPRSRRELFQQQLQCRNNCGALFGLERSRSRHEVHNCPARNEVS